MTTSQVMQDANDGITMFYSRINARKRIKLFGGSLPPSWVL